jgi:hypothetical protein
MGNAKISKDFSTGKYADSDLTIKTGHIVEKMTDNTNFATPDPALANITAGNNALIAAMAKVQNGSKEDTVIKNNCRSTLETMLKSEADYVQRTSNGDEAIILSSGFDVNKKPGTVGQLTKPLNLITKPGENHGTLWVSCDVVASASFYEFTYTEAPVTANSLWTQKTTTKHKLLIEGLISGKQYTCRVAGAGSDPSRVWSDDVSSYVL